jgi:Holliday junction resolvasome RuvABC endonuclease subunit
MHFRGFALDLSKSTGWCSGRDLDDPVFGVLELPRGAEVTEGRAFNEYRKWLTGMVTIDRPTHIAFESPMLGGDVPFTAAYLLIGLAAITEQVAEEYGIDCSQAAVSSVRLFFCGDGRAKKDDVGFKCRQLGWPITNHNAADAAALYAFLRTAVLGKASEDLLFRKAA